MGSAKPPLVVHCLHVDCHRQLCCNDAGTTSALGDVLAAAAARFASVEWSVLVRVAVCNKVAQRSTHLTRGPVVHTSQRIGEMTVVLKRKTSKAKSTSRSSKPRKAATKSKSASKAATGKRASGASDKRSHDLEDWRGATLDRMRKLILEADPDMTEERKWKKPSNRMTGVP